MPSKDNPIVSSHRDAATRVSTFLDESHGIKLKPIVALEVIARALGAANWQVLKAMAEQGRAPRSGDASVFIGYAQDLPPIGPGNVLTDLVEFAPLSMTRRPSTATVTDDLCHQLVSRRHTARRSLGDVEPAIKSAQDAMGLRLTDEQLGAVRTSLKWPLCLVTGVEGTGKYTTAIALLRSAAKAGLSNVFNAVAPADTIVGDVKFPTGSDNYNALVSQCLAPVAQSTNLDNCELLIVDERVLRDENLILRILGLVPARCHLVFMCEALPEVGPAIPMQYLAYLVTHEYARHISLTQKLRQEPRGRIGSLLAIGDSSNTPMEVSSEGRITVDNAPELNGPTFLDLAKIASRSLSHKRLDTVMIITDGEPVFDTAKAPVVYDQKANDALGMPREAYAMHGFFDNGTMPPTQSNNGHHYVYEAPAFQTTDRTGKWCIFRDAETVDALWAKIQQAVVNNELPAGMVSTPKNAARYKGTYLICVYTHEWRNESDVMRVREILRGMGVTEELGYKRDLDTVNQVYNVPKEWYYRA